MLYEYFKLLPFFLDFSLLSKKVLLSHKIKHVMQIVKMIKNYVDFLDDFPFIFKFFVIFILKRLLKIVYIY